MRSLVPDCWWQKTGGLKVVTLKKNLRYGHELSLGPEEGSRQLDEIRAQGFQAIEIFAPAEGFQAYNGLDTKNHYRIDPELGTMDDFRRLVRLAHEKTLAVIVFINLGYFSAEAPDWIQACRDKRAGEDTDEVKWFLWSDKADAPPPPTQEDIYVTQAERERSKDSWGWHYSEAADSCFWARWRARDQDRRTIPLPQVSWASPGWREEAERIVRFWMDTGLDGMLIDAPLCYPYQTWEHNRRIVEVIKSYGNVMIDPEGGRDPAWMTEAGYNCIHEYGLSYESIDTGNPAEIEPKLERYHDAMLNAGAVLYARGLKGFDGDLAKRRLQHGLLAGIGDIIVYTKRNAYAQPEGGGGFHEDPVAWITEGGWNSVQDYGLGIWWEKDNHVLRNAIENGDPRPVERALRDYHDRVMAAGGRSRPLRMRNTMRS